MSFELRSEELTARYRIPSYVDWLQHCDMRPAYEWHRLVLQILQRRFRGRRWVLKSPVHLHSIPTLHEVFPGARLVVTHRDPLPVLGSVTSLIAVMRYAHSDAVDFAEIGSYHADLYARSLDGLVDLDSGGVLSQARTHHTHYAAFVRDPVATVKSAFEALGRSFSPAIESEIDRHLASNPRDAKGAHAYAFDDLGLDRETTRARFARYQERFDVDSEAGA